ncbi:TonB-dependent hemoglobin/transferrin/lactoferrin family receptor [Janthinobacterium fluminis]|uniref:TonB-dependent hemoglobin/transferrin/lactoferrin family receptor n=1 Tax=Janthinobacterium fluminis TaxID=2987524 RepID=A0ABT5K0Q0_9BURK|nr:TonB-dependent hemoglobin/transferrin/lactoferrin family receptor [Janthinobacterium fluminis]MDC8758542.1 TonB-dependent hemoglobin/transferrin/lactoferrin family receptor [Janthinobacterium fluminis]
MNMNSRGTCAVRPMAVALALAFGAPVFAAQQAPVVVAALPAVTVFGESISAANVGRSYLKSEDVERQQADNMAALLDTLPGVDLTGTSRPGGQSLNIWGFNKVQDVKVIVDGVPKGFEKYRQGSVFIEPELIKQLEVNKGPHTSLYGNGGFGGVVTVETKDAKDMLRAGANVGAFLKYARHSNNHENDTTASVYARSADGRFDGLAFVTQRKSDDLRKPDGALFRFSALDAPSGLAKLNIRLTPEQLLTVSAMRSRSTGWGPFAAFGEDTPAPSAGDIKKYGSDEAWRRKAIYRDQQDDTYAAKWRFTPRDNPLLNVTASFGHSKTRQYDQRSATATPSSFLGSLGNASWASYKDRLAELRNESLFSSGALEHVLSVGLQWHGNQRDTLMYYPEAKALKDPAYNYGYFQPYYMPAGEQKTTGLYLQDAVTRGALTLTAALRYDHVASQGVPNLAPRYNSPLPEAGHDYRAVTHQGWSPRLGVFWQTSSNMALFADLSNTWRAPTIDELYSVEYYKDAKASSSKPGTSRALEVERITAARVGAMLSGKGWFAPNDNAQLRVTLFQNRVHDSISRRLGELVPPGTKPTGVLSNYRNLPGMRTEGLELESFYNAPRFFAHASLALQYGARRGSQRNPWGLDEPVSSIAPDKLVLGAGWHFPEQGMSAGWQGKFLGAQEKVLPSDSVYYLAPSKAYGLHSLFASWQGRGGMWRDVSARLTVDNLLNRDYRPYLSEGVTGVGRNFKLSVSKSF